MSIRNASVVELGSPDLATVLGIHPDLAAYLEEVILEKTQTTYGRFCLTLMHDNRICIEKDFLPLECQCILCKQRRKNDRALLPPYDFPDALAMENTHEPNEEG